MFSPALPRQRINPVLPEYLIGDDGGGPVEEETLRGPQPAVDQEGGVGGRHYKSVEAY